MSKEFREFVATWIETGFEWYEADPKNITGYRFGHDFNNDYSNKTYYRKGLVGLPDIPAKMQGVGRSRKNIFCELIPALIVHVKTHNVDIDTLLGWLRREGLSAPPRLGWDDFFVKQIAYCMYHVLEEEK